MNFEQVRTYLLKKKGAVEERPFGPDTLVYKVGGKMFALMGIDNNPLRINLKCDPDEALFLRDIYPNAVLPGYHMNKRHWNTIILNGTVPDDEFWRMVDDSYNLIVKRLPKAVQQQLTDDL